MRLEEEKVREEVCRQPPILSLVMPVYNVEPFVGACLDSVLAALGRLDAHEFVEVICVDDGSTDRSGEILDLYQGRFGAVAVADRVSYTVIHKKNGGVSSARNLGLDRANGEWIWLIDSDDEVAPLSLRFLSRALRKNPVDILKFRHREVSSQDAPFSSEESPVVSYDMTNDEDVRKVFQRCAPGLVLWQACFRRATIGDIRLQDGMQPGEDAVFATQVTVRSTTFAITETVLYGHFAWPGSCMAKPNVTRLRCWIEAISIRVEAVRAWTHGTAAMPVLLKVERNSFSRIFVDLMREIGFRACRPVLPRYFEVGVRVFEGRPFQQFLFRLRCLPIIVVFLYWPWKAYGMLLRVGIARRMRAAIGAAD